LYVGVPDLQDTDTDGAAASSSDGEALAPSLQPIATAPVQPMTAARWCISSRLMAFNLGYLLGEDKTVITVSKTAGIDFFITHSPEEMSVVSMEQHAAGTLVYE
jgi:hypothetical protein